MRNPKRLVVTFCLISVLAISAFAETPTGSCPAPDPGQMSTPPCSSAQLTTDDFTTSEEMPTTRAEAETVVISMIVEAAVGAILSVF